MNPDYSNNRPAALDGAKSAIMADFEKVSTFYTPLWHYNLQITLNFNARSGKNGLAIGYTNKYFVQNLACSSIYPSAPGIAVGPNGFPKLELIQAAGKPRPKRKGIALFYALWPQRMGIGKSNDRPGNREMKHNASVGYGVFPHQHKPIGCQGIQNGKRPE